MERGTSKPWQEVLFEATGDTRLDPSAIREFFQPLEEWLRAENFRTNELVGWTYGEAPFFSFSLGQYSYCPRNFPKSYYPFISLATCEIDE